MPTARQRPPSAPDMALSFFSKNKKAVQNRFRDDYATKMRLKYDPYYHAMESQHGTNVRLDGRDMIKKQPFERIRATLATAATALSDDVS